MAKIAELYVLFSNTISRTVYRTHRVQAQEAYLSTVANAREHAEYVDQKISDFKYN